jgi:hypothetical protein
MRLPMPSPARREVGDRLDRIAVTFLLGHAADADDADRLSRREAACAKFEGIAIDAEADRRHLLLVSAQFDQPLPPQVADR